MLTRMAVRRGSRFHRTLLGSWCKLGYVKREGLLVDGATEGTSLPLVGSITSVSESAADTQSILGMSRVIGSGWTRRVYPRGKGSTAVCRVLTIGGNLGACGPMTRPLSRSSRGPPIASTRSPVPSSQPIYIDRSTTGSSSPFLRENPSSILYPTPGSR